MSLQTEQELLGLCLNNNEIAAAYELLPDHFSEPVHQDIMAEIREGVSLGKRVSPVTLRDRYDAKYLAGLIGCAASSRVADILADKLKKTATHIKLNQLAISIQEAASNEDAMTLITSAMDDIQRVQLGNQLRTAKQVSLNIINDLADNSPVYSTGLPRLDFAMNGGLQQGRMYAFPADSGHGKTLLASTISNNLKNNRVPHLYICAEMGENETHQRSMAKDMRIDSRAFYDETKRNETFWSDIGHHANTENECLIYYDDPFLIFDRLKQVVSTAVIKYGIKGFILDYWQLVGGGEGDRADFLGRVAQWQAAACKRWKLFCINTAQLNRDGEILGSGGLKRASDQVYHLIRPEETQPYAYLKMTKSRYTKTMHVGSETNPSLKINELGGYFEQVSAY